MLCSRSLSFVSLLRTVTELFDFQLFGNSPFFKICKINFPPQNRRKKSRVGIRYFFSMFNMHFRAKFGFDSLGAARCIDPPDLGTFWVSKYLKIPQKYNFGGKKCELQPPIEINEWSSPNGYRRLIFNRSRGIRPQNFRFGGFSTLIGPTNVFKNRHGG